MTVLRVAGFCLTCLVFLSMTLTPNAQAAIIYVSPNGTNGDGSSWASAKTTVAAGLAAAAAGDEVRVAKGLYKESAAVQSGVSFYGGYSGVGEDRDPKRYETILDAQKASAVVSICSGTVATTVVDGFTIRNAGGNSAAGVFCAVSNARITNNHIIWNSGPGIKCTGSATIACNTIVANSGGVSCESQSAVVVDNVILANFGYGVNVASASPVIANNTIVNNNLAGIMCGYNASAAISNNVVALNGSGVTKNTTYGTCVLRSNCLYGNGGSDYSGISPGAGDISQDPKLADLESGNVHIQPDSPCIDTGDDAAVVSGLSDLDGQARIQGTHVDIGADESDGTTWEAGPYAVIRVSPTGDDANEGSSWASAKKTLEAGIDAAGIAGGEVWIKAGVYYEMVNLYPGSRIYGGFAGSETERDQRDWRANSSVIDGRSGSGIAVVRVAGGLAPGCAVIDGLTICSLSNRNALYGISAVGAATISHNNVQGNVQAGIVCSAPCIIRDNRIVANGGDGIGQGLFESAIVSNTIAGNAGAGISFQGGSLTIINNIVAFNSSGIESANSRPGTPVIRANCVYGNGSSDYVGVTPGATDVSKDPKLAGIEFRDAHIQPDSPCLDAGDDTAVVAGDKDIDGQARIQGPHIDIGADESDGTTWNPVPCVVRVSPTGDDANDGSSWTSAKRTLQAAISAAMLKGGEVWAAAGIYNEQIALQSGSYVYGGFAGTETERDQRNWQANETVIDVKGLAIPTHAVVIRTVGSSAVFDGFTVKNASYIYDYASAIKCDGGRPSILHNKLMQNYGSGVYCAGSTPLIQDNTITGNDDAVYCTNGSSPLILNNLLASNTCGVTCISSSPEIRGNVMRENGTGVACSGSCTSTIANNRILFGSCGVYCNSSSPLIANNEIVGNCGGSYAGGICCKSASPQILNNTIVSNYGNGAGGIYCLDLSSPTIANNIIAFNSSGVVKGAGSAGGTPSLRNNCVYNPGGADYTGVSTGTGDFSADPKLVSLQYGQVHIQPDSPCRDAGDDSVVQPGWTDVDGQARVQGPHVDIGSDESDGTVGTVEPVVVRVSPSGNDTNDGSSWLLAKKTIQSAVDALPAEGGEVWVAAGTYQENIIVTGPAFLYGGFVGTEMLRSDRDPKVNVTVLDGGGSPTVTMSNSGFQQSAIDGFTVRNGKSTGTAIAGGITCSSGSPTISNNIITACSGGAIAARDGAPTIKDNVVTGDDGWAIYCYLGTSPTISGNTVCGNKGDAIHIEGVSGTISGNTIAGNQGYGIYSWNVTATISNNTIHDNRGGIHFRTPSGLIADNFIYGNNSAYAGGIYCFGTICDTSYAPTIVNNTIVGNGGGKVGGIYCYFAFPTVANNLIAFNSSGIFCENNSAYYTNTYPTLLHNCIYNPDGFDYSNVPVGMGDISLDPMIASIDYGNVHIQPGSPCIDAGDDASVQQGWLDIDAQQRIMGAHVDIGADESDGTTWTFTPAVVRVSPSGDDANDGSSWALAKKTVQAGIDAAAPVGGEVWVAAGTYKERISLRSGAYVLGGFPGTENDETQRDWRLNKTVLDGNASGSVVTASDGCRFSSIDGFIIRNGYGSGDGGGVYCMCGSPAISNCVITGNTSSYGSGGGISCSSSALRITNCFISGNSAAYRAGINASSSSVNITNSVVCNNVGGGVTGYDSSLSLFSSTIVGNWSNSPSYAVSLSRGRLRVHNTIVAFNSSGIAASDLYSTPEFSNNCVYNPDGSDYAGVTAGAGDISVDPKLASLLYGEAHIQPDSPCRDAGDDTAVEVGWVDMDGQARIQGAHVDIGADESDGTTWTVEPVIIRVSAAGSDSNDGSSWSSAKKTIQAASDAAASEGGEVWVAEGVYRESVQLRPRVALFGGFAGTEDSRDQRDWVTRKCVIDGSNHIGSSVVTADDLGPAYCVLDGFTIQGGTGSYADGSNCGGGVLCVNSNPTIANCLIKSNYVSGGGGGIHCSSSSPSISNVIIYGNQARGCGGGISCSSTSAPTIANCTIAANVAAGGGGVCCTSSSPKLVNNIISSNSSGVLVNWTGSNMVLLNNCVYNPDGANYSGVSAGSGDISVDPKLVSVEYGRLHIQPDSPCVDAGDDTVVQPEWVDMDGQPRIQGAHVDMGADESDGTTWDAQHLVVRVSTTGDDANDGSNWALAKKTLAAAVDAASAEGGGEVWAAAGNYSYEWLTLRGSVSLFGGFSGTESTRAQRRAGAGATVINGGGVSFKTFTRYAPGGIDGFTICNSVQPITSSYASPIISNNCIAANGGAGIACSYSAAEITNNTIAANVGVGISCTSSSDKVSNNVIAYNPSGIHASGTPVLRNNCFYNPDGADYTRVSAGVGDISADPKLVSVQYGRLHIQPDSPCRDAGDDTAVPAGSVDMDGQPRVQGAHVDMGADESDDAARSAEPVIVRVSTTGDDANDGSSWALAKKSVQAAMDAASAKGGEVWVAAGTYNEPIRLRSFTHLVGGFAGTEQEKTARDWNANRTVLDGGGPGGVVTTETGYRVNSIDGFTIRGGKGSFASGIVSYYASPLFTNNIISDNEGYGIRCSSGQPIISRNVITRNGGGVYCQSAAVISDNIISANASTGDGGGVYCFGAPAVIVNNTVVGNSATSGGGIACLSSSAWISNNIIAFNSSGLCKLSSYGTLTPALRNNCVFNPDGEDYSGLSAGTGDISADPFFVDMGNADYHLRPGSPCIDAGLIDNAPAEDLDGNARPKDGDGDGIAGVDIGCYEAPGSYATVSEAKALPDGRTVGVLGIVTAAFKSISYVESTDRTSGIGVSGVSLPLSRLVTVEGVMETIDGERMIGSPSVTSGPSTSAPAPWFLNPDSLGGGVCGLQSGVWDWRPVRNPDTGEVSRELVSSGGASNVGLLVKVAGRVGNAGSGFFYLDGGGVYDEGDPAVKGVRVEWPFSETMPAEGSFVEIIGISSCRIVPGSAAGEGVVVRLLRPISPDALRLLEQ